MARSSGSSASVPPGRARRLAARRRSWADRRRLRCLVDDIEHGHVSAVEGYLEKLSSATASVAAITLVENRPSLRLLQIDMDAGQPSLLASVDHASLHQLSSLSLPALICIGRTWRQRSGWQIELTTLDQVVTVVADELVVADDLSPASAEGAD